MAEDPNLDYDKEDFMFTIMQDDGNEVELIKNGKNIKVTNKTRREYARKVARFHLLRQVSTEMREFIKGFY